ncbi:MAG: YigZ family protein, partial [Bradymonadaceae bacterium]
VRYYGGVELGTGGLTRAYRSTAREAIDEAGIVERYPEERIEVTIAYDRHGEVEHFLETHDHARMVETEYGGEVTL